MAEEQLELLVRYIAWVIDNEGVDFITAGDHGIWSNFFSEEEWLLLHDLADRAKEYA